MEYRGYDSAGIALHQKDHVTRLRALGKVQALEDLMIEHKPKSKLGIAHTRWATHGKPSEANAHPHASSEQIYIVHNGIIENYKELTKKLKDSGYQFASQTDSELIAHLIHHHYKNNDLLCAIQAATKELEGAYAIAAVDLNHKDQLVIARYKSPLLIGVGIEENFAASDPLALAQLTSDFVFLEDLSLIHI